MYYPSVHFLCLLFRLVFGIKGGQGEKEVVVAFIISFQFFLAMWTAKIFCCLKLNLFTKEKQGGENPPGDNQPVPWRGLGFGQSQSMAGIGMGGLHLLSSAAALLGHQQDTQSSKAERGLSVTGKLPVQKLSYIQKLSPESHPPPKSSPPFILFPLAVWSLHHHSSTQTCLKGTARGVSHPVPDSQLSWLTQGKT